MVKYVKTKDERITHRLAYIYGSDNRNMYWKIKKLYEKAGFKFS